MYLRQMCTCTDVCRMTAHSRFMGLIWLLQRNSPEDLRSGRFVLQRTYLTFKRCFYFNLLPVCVFFSLYLDDVLTSVFCHSVFDPPLCASTVIR